MQGWIKGEQTLFERSRVNEVVASKFIFNKFEPEWYGSRVCVGVWNKR
jgi:hypothetical protein